MRLLILLFLASFLFLDAYGQSQKFDKLIESENFVEAVKLEDQADKLTPEQVFRLGFAFYALDQEQKAITYFDKAIAQGNINAVVPFYKGLALMALNDYSAAIKSFNLALTKRPNDPNMLASAARAHALAKHLQQAIILSRKAIQQPNCPNEAFEVLMYAAGTQGGPTAILEQLNSLRDSVARLANNYCTLVSFIGRLHSEEKEYPKALRAFREGTGRCPDDYTMQQNLLLACNKVGKYAAADSIFRTLSQAFTAGKLPEAMSRPKNTLIYDFPWRDQSVRVMRHFVTTREAMKPVYRIMLFDKKQEDVERSLVIELRSSEAQKMGIPFSLAEYGLGSTIHRAYGVYWKSDDIPVSEIEAAVTKILNETYVIGERSGPDKLK